ncbi:MAG: prenyltransferase [Candidatus Aminicenantes bacterium]|nr:prenyltransferase [Candidatus Aminicenantes bacterium]
MKIKVWLFQIRAPFLVLAVVLVLIGIAAADFKGQFEWIHAALVMFGVVLAHISVNLFNELSDYQTGIDQNTVQTPFSGGSGMMQSGETSPKAVRIMAYSTLLVSALIGIYFCLVSGWLILVFMISGAVAIRFYTSHISRWLIGELVSGLTLGSFVVMGTYYALTANLGFDIVLLSIPSGILTALLLFLNEFPDLEADKKGGRYHLVIHFGRKKSSFIYVLGLIVVYVAVLGISFLKTIPDTILIALITLPMAFKSSITVLKNHNDIPKLIPALAMNVGVVIFTDLFMAIGLFIA